jgi:hypothetical protein
VPEKNPLVCQLLLKFLNDEYAGRVGISISGHIMMLFRSALRMETRLGLLYVWKGCTRPELFAKRGGGGMKDIPEAARMKTLAQRPATHLSFGLGMLKWKTSRAMVPKALSFARMDVWLFERAGNAGDLSGKELF